MKDNYEDKNGITNFIEGAVITAKYRGRQCGVQYAEGFRLPTNLHGLTTYRILP